MNPLAFVAALDAISSMNADVPIVALRTADRPFERANQPELLFQSLSDVKRA
jgi:hypothetical protein